MSTFRVAIIGCSRIGRTHARAYQSEPRANIVAVCDIDQPKAEALKKEFAPKAKIYLDYKEMLHAEKPDHVSVVAGVDQRRQVGLAPRVVEKDVGDDGLQLAGRRRPLVRKATAPQGRDAGHVGAP